MSLFLRSSRPLLLGVALLLSQLAPAQAAEPATLLNLSASAQRELPNDQLNATLYIQERQPQAAQLADKLNRTLNRAKADAAGYPKVTISSGNYNSWPSYDKNGKINGWQGRADIRLHSRDFTAAAELIAQLQKYMLLEGVQFSVADSTRKATEQTLIPEAIAQLQHQAAAAGKALGKQQQQVRELTIGESQPNMPPMLMRAKAMTADAAAEVATPEWQPGNSTIQLNVSGRIELQ